MALMIYRSEVSIPKNVLVVRNNCEYFMNHTINKLDVKLNGVTKHTDGAVYVDGAHFKDKYGFDVPWFGLSAGGMTLLNIFYNPEVCFDTLECGHNALGDLKNITNGCVIGKGIVDLDGDDVCCVCFDGNKNYLFTSVRGIYE